MTRFHSKCSSDFIRCLVYNYHVCLGPRWDLPFSIYTSEYGATLSSPREIDSLLKTSISNQTNSTVQVSERSTKMAICLEKVHSLLRNRHAIAPQKLIVFHFFFLTSILEYLWVFVIQNCSQFYLLICLFFIQWNIEVMYICTLLNFNSKSYNSIFHATIHIKSEVKLLAFSQKVDVHWWLSLSCFLTKKIFSAHKRLYYV